jgi:hypothetical protein
MTKDVSAIIIGAGPSGIAMAHKLKQKLGFNDFTVSRTSDCLHQRKYLTSECRSTRNWMDLAELGGQIYILGGNASPTATSRYLLN